MRALLQCEHFVVRITGKRSSINFMDDLFPVYFGLLQRFRDLHSVAEAEYQLAVGVDRDVVHRGSP